MIVHDSLMKIFGKQYSFVVIDMLSSSGSQPPVPIEYDYPTFEINSNGELLATYNTDNRNLSFKLENNGNLLAMYNGANPLLQIVGSDLIRTIND